MEKSFNFNKTKFSSVDKFIHIPRKEIFYINFIFESYEDIGFITTIDPYKAILKITLSPFFLNEFNNIIKDLKKELEYLNLKKDLKFDI